MALLLKGLHYTISNISTIIQSCVFLLGSILVLIPIYHFLTIADKRTLKKFSQSCINLLGLYDVISPYSTIINTKDDFYYHTSVLSSADDIVTYELNSPIDTQVCLLPEYSSAMVAGLINTGNSCFLNSVLQSLSSLPKLQIYLDQLSTTHSTSKIPVTQSLLKTLRLLSAPSDDTFQPIDIVRVLKNNHRVVNREQQDAQELYQLLVSELETETSKLNKKEGFRDILSFGSASKKNISMIENPLTGLIAYRTSCMQCGYTSGIPMHSFNNVQLTLPTADITTLDECLKQLTSMEYLNDVECSKCSLINTVQNLGTEIESLQQQPNKNEKMQCLEKVKKEIEHRLEVGIIEQEEEKENNSGGNNLKGMISKSIGVKSKQGMFAKPPKVLCLHFVRSVYLPSGDVLKNTCQVQYPEILDLTPYCTNGTLETQPYLPISTPDHVSSVKYRLMSSVVHYGDHYSGHYIAYKRRLLADHCGCDKCGHDNTDLKSHDSEWFRISDDRVKLCETDDALRENPFMLLYELVEEEQDTVTELVPELIHTLPTPSTVTMDQQQQQAAMQVEEQHYWQESESDQEDLEELLSSNVPAAPPSSPIMEPLTTYTKKPNRRNVNSKKRHSISHLKLNNHHSIPILTQ